MDNEQNLEIEFQFDHKQDFQLAAIDAVVDVFKGQPLNAGDFQISLSGSMGEGLFASQKQTELGFGNQLAIDNETLFQNVKTVQLRNRIVQPDAPFSRGRNFSIEMETGTGKTYVYLRTAFELNARYGFKKFIIVVPSVAIREGVLKSIEDMQEGFQELYHNVPFKYFVYDSKRVSDVPNFARGIELQFMIINIDSFNKATNNVIYQDRDGMSGFKPIEFIQATNPIVIMDEPQNMESEKARKAIQSLNPLCTLRYSATHRDRYNMLYSLDPVRAYQQRLVKKISVASTMADNDPNAAWLRLDEVKNDKGKISCRLSFHKQSKDGATITSAKLKHDDDLFLKSGEHEQYRNGFIINEINSRPGMEYIRFANGVRLRLGEEKGSNRREVVREQIEATIRAHFDKEYQVQGKGLKVLSLFFIDSVKNYRVHREDGYELGKYAKWFEEIYTKVAEEYRDIFTDIIPVELVHNGYFSKDRKGKLKDTRGNTQADEDTYSLIMKEKKRLLKLNEPLKFIWSHSALREGWDNPNVFQICTLNETKSTLKKRQEIGRGLRLPVNQEGVRVRDEQVNTLVVVANESYHDFARALQKELEEECGVVFGRLPVDAFLGLRYVEQEEEKELSPEQSEQIWKHLQAMAYIAGDGAILEAFDEAVESLTFSIAEGIPVSPHQVARIVEEYKLENLVREHKKPRKAKVNEKVLLDPEFERFWNTINTKTIYSVRFSTEALIEKAARVIAKMPTISAPKVYTDTADLDITSKGVSTQLVQQGAAKYLPPAKVVPDILTYIQNKTELTRATIAEILIQSRRLDDLPVNPQRFMDQSVKEIRQIMNRVIIEGIQYERLEGVQYEMSRFREEAESIFFPEERIIPTEKSVYDYIVFDSKVEKKFAQGLESLKSVKYFIKLPNWFTIETPVGEYNPDWAIFKHNGDIVYMIRETKSTKEQLKLRGLEVDKIECGRRHFESIGVDYEVATGIEDVRG